MDRQKRIATILSLCAVAGIRVGWSTAAAKSAIAPSICARLVAQMRAAPATVLNDRVVPKMRPWIINAVSRPAQGDPAYRYLPHEWHIMGGRGASSPTIETLPGTDLSMISAIAGSGDCLQSQFFERRQANAVRVLNGWPIAAGLCSRQDTWGGLAMVLGEPAFIAYGSLNPDNMDSLLIIAPWKGNAWGRACPVSIRFTYRYEVTQLYCGAPERVCAAAHKVAAEVRRRYHAWDVSDNEAFNDYGHTGPKFRFRGAPSAHGRALVALARKLGIPRHLAPAHRARAAWLQRIRPYAAVYFPLKLNGTLYVGAATRTSNRYPAYLWHHWVFIVFTPPNARTHRLTSLAAFTVHRITSGVRSIEARNESAPANETQSTRIP
jgi:hypothetical protein